MSDNDNIRKLLEEAKEKQRIVKKMILDILSGASTPNITKEKLKDQIFKVYLEIKWQMD